MGPVTEKSKYSEGVVLVYHEAATGKIVRIIEAGPNIVTDKGDQYYAQKGAGETPTNTFSAGRVVVAKSMTVTGANKKSATFGKLITRTTKTAFQSGYPKTADTDINNTARTIDGITYKAIYGTTTANYTIGAVAISRAAGATSSSGQLLSAKTLSAAEKVVKTSSLTLTVYVTHVFLGV